MTMKFKNFLEQNSGPITVPINKIYGWKVKFDEVIDDFSLNKLSMTEGPITLSRLDDPRGFYFLMDGYHRTVSAALAGQSSIQAVIDKYVPNIDRTGGAYASYLTQKAPIVDLINLIKST